MSEVSKRLRDRRQNVWEQAKALADTAAEENRAFSAEEQGSWDALNEELDNLDKRIKSVLDGEARAKEADDAFNRLSGKPQESGRREDQTADELRAWLRGESRDRFYDVKPSGRVDFRSILKGGTGGNVVPTSFYDRLVAHLIEMSGLMQASPTVLNTASGETIQIPKTTAHSTSTPAEVAEAVTIPTSDPTFGQVSLGAYKYGVLHQVSRELLTDSGVDLEGYLAMQAGRAIGNQLGQRLVTGTGSTMPRGVALDAGTGFTPAGGLIAGGGFGAQSTADQGFDILINVLHSVIAPYRASTSCSWLMNDNTASKVRKIKSTDGVYAWQPAVTVGAPDTILGKPVFIDPYVASVAANAKSILFGDFSQYFIRLAGGVRFERSDDFAFGSDLVSFRALLRGDGALVDLTGAVKALVHP
ncbi:MAG: phage major capsid protein, partial [Haloechinothrix sp.]